MQRFGGEDSEDEGLMDFVMKKDISHKVQSEHHPRLGGSGGFGAHKLGGMHPGAGHKPMGHGIIGKFKSSGGGAGGKH